MKPNLKISNFFISAILLVSFLGFADASYLSIKYFVGTPLPCSVLKGCEEVTTSHYSKIIGIPVALLGSFYYLTIFALVFSYLIKSLSFDKSDKVDSEMSKKTLMIFARLTVVGLAASLWFVYLQLFVIKAICLYCMFSASTSVTLFVFGIFVLKFNKSRILSN